MGVGKGTVCPGSVSVDKGQKAGSALGFGAKLEGLQFAGIPLSVIWCCRDSGLLRQLQEVLELLTVSVF